MGPLEGYRVGKAFTYDVGAHCHPATGFQFFPPGVVGDLHHLGMDPPMGVAYRIWFLWSWLGSGSRWLGWDLRPGSSSGDGNSLGAFCKGRPWWICRPCYSRDKSIGSLNSLSFSQEESHSWGQCRFTTQVIIYVKPDMFLVSLQLGWGPCFAMPCFWTPRFLIVILGLSCGDRATHL